MKIEKIVCASYGSVGSVDACAFAKVLSDKFGSEIIKLYVKPSSYFEGIEYVPTNQSSIYQKWIEDNSSEMIYNLRENAGKVEVRDGTPYKEILHFAREIKADIIAVNSGKGMEAHPSISRTIVKLVRQSEIPVLTVNVLNWHQQVKNILVPSGLHDLNSSDLKYALELAEATGGKVYHLNVLETAEINYPAEVVESLRGDAYERFAENDMKYKNVVPKVTEARNVWEGVSEFADVNEIDLVIINTYVGAKGRRHDFIGTVTERVIQNVNCPVLTIRP